MADDLKSFCARIRACTLCEGDMPNRPNPIFRVSESARILIASQAPGNRADTTGVPFNDPSGVRLRAWLAMDEAEFYDSSRVAIVPMGFCFPGHDGKGGDLPPMKRCAAEWRAGLLDRLPHVALTILIGGYAQAWHLGAARRKSLRETVANWREFARDGVFVTPHPSWRNTAWLKANPWFEADVLPVLQASVRSQLSFR